MRSDLLGFKNCAGVDPTYVVRINALTYLGSHNFAYCLANVLLLFELGCSVKLVLDLLQLT